MMCGSNHGVTSGLAVFLLGGVEARRSSAPIPVPGLKMQALLALLALSAPGPVTDDRLIDEIWGDERLSNPSNSLHSQVAMLRRAVGRDAVVRTGLGYTLAVDPDDVDATRFASLIERARGFARDGDVRSAARARVPDLGRRRTDPGGGDGGLGLVGARSRTRDGGRRRRWAGRVGRPVRRRPGGAQCRRRR